MEAIGYGWNSMHGTGWAAVKNVQYQELGAADPTYLQKAHMNLAPPGGLEKRL